jgi:hypothetical protein
MIIFPYTCFPSILSRRVLLQGTTLPFSLVEILAICPIGNSVVGPEQAALAELWEEKGRNIIKRGRKQGIGLDEEVSVGS